jgi:hypothetical protein
MRELFEQFIAYARAYSDAIPTYTPRDNHLSGAAITLSGALTWICTAIEYRSAQARSPLLSEPAPPSTFAPLSDPDDSTRFLIDTDDTCPEWSILLERFKADTGAWVALDANIPASDWTPDQRAVIDAITPVMTRFAEAIESTGRRSPNPVIQDFAVLAGQYRRAYVAALPSYTAADSYLATASLRLTSTLYEACQALAG